MSVDTIRNAGTVIWNGPVGVFEFEHFLKGTKMVAEAVGETTGFALAGGMNTIEAIEKVWYFGRSRQYF